MSTKISLLFLYYSKSDISLQFSINIEIDNKCSNKKLKWRFLWKHLYCRVLWNKGQEGSKVIPPTQKPLLLHGNCSRKVKRLASTYFWWNCQHFTHFLPWNTIFDRNTASCKVTQEKGGHQLKSAGPAQDMTWRERRRRGGGGTHFLIIHTFQLSQDITGDETTTSKLQYSGIQNHIKVLNIFQCHEVVPK